MLDSCVKADNPSTVNKKCIQFKEAMGPEKMPGKGNTILIMYGKKKMKTICYPEDPCAATRGWCGTCLRDADYGGYGYCQVGGYCAGQYMSKKENKICAHLFSRTECHLRKMMSSLRMFKLPSIGVSVPIYVKLKR